MSVDNATFIVQRGDEKFSCIGSELNDKVRGDDLFIIQDDDFDIHPFSRKSVTRSVIKKGLDLDEWLESPDSFDGEWSSIVHGDGTWVAVAKETSGPVAIVSPDGKHWSLANTPAEASATKWLDVAYGGGKFLAVGNASGTNNSVMVSDDGQDWTLISTPEEYLRVTAYGNGIWLAIRMYGGTPISHVIKSTDGGLTWSYGTDIGSTTFSDLTYAEGVWIALAAGNICYRSDDDGATWTNYEIVKSPGGSITAARAEKAVYGSSAKRWVIVGRGGTGSGVWYSDNTGLTWSEGTRSKTAVYLSAVGYGDGYFVAVGPSDNVTYENIFYSTDGASFDSAIAFAGQFDSIDCAPGKEKFVALNSKPDASYIAAQANDPIDERLFIVTDGDNGHKHVTGKHVKGLFGDPLTLVTDPILELLCPSAVHKLTHTVCDGGKQPLKQFPKWSAKLYEAQLPWTKNAAHAPNKLYNSITCDGRLYSIGDAVVLSTTDGLTFTTHSGFPFTFSFAYQCKLTDDFSEIILVTNKGTAIGKENSWREVSVVVTDPNNGGALIDGYLRCVCTHPRKAGHWIGAFTESGTAGGYLIDIDVATGSAVPVSKTSRYSHVVAYEKGRDRLIFSAGRNLGDGDLYYIEVDDLNETTTPAGNRISGTTYSGSGERSTVSLDGNWLYLFDGRYTGKALTKFKVDSQSPEKEKFLEGRTADASSPTPTMLVGSTLYYGEISNPSTRRSIEMPPGEEFYWGGQIGDVFAIGYNNNNYTTSMALDSDFSEIFPPFGVMAPGFYYVEEETRDSSSPPDKVVATSNTLEVSTHPCP